MRFVLTADVDAGVHRPGMPLAQVLREIEPVVEFASPLVNGRLTDRWSGVTRATWEVLPQAVPAPQSVRDIGEVQFILTIDIPDDIPRPGLPIAQMLREIEPVIETMLPLVPGFLNDRLTGDVKASWLVGIPVVTAPIVTTYAPNPAPPNEPFGMSLTGNFFPLDAQVYFDGVPAPLTSVYSQWSITGTGPTLPAGTHQCMLVCSGLGYAHFEWTFGLPADTPTLTSLDPNPAPVSGATTDVTCNGTGFTTASKVWVNGAEVVTTFVSATLLTGVLPGSAVAVTWSVLVRTPGLPDTASIDWVIQ